MSSYIGSCLVLQLPSICKTIEGGKTQQELQTQETSQKGEICTYKNRRLSFSQPTTPSLQQPRGKYEAQ
jgi:hypothetical protein